MCCSSYCTWQFNVFPCSLQAALNLVNVKDFHIEKIIAVDSEDELDNDSGGQSAGRFTLRLYNEKQQTTSSVYLVIESKEDLVSILLSKNFVRN